MCCNYEETFNISKWWRSICSHVESHECEGEKKEFSAEVSSFPLYLKLSHFNQPLSNDPHIKRPLIDYYLTTRAANGLSLPVCPVYLCLINTSVSVWRIVHRVCSWLCLCVCLCTYKDMHASRGVSVYWWETECSASTLSSPVSSILLDLSFTPWHKCHFSNWP